ncbi:ABC transporter substrate-binding protein [Arthrobacter sp. Z1-9]
MSSKKMPILSTAALLTTLFLTACGGGSNTGASQAPAGSTKLTVAVATAPLSLDTSKAANGSPNRWFEDPAYESLIKFDAEGKLVPGLAEQWGYVGTDNKTFEVQLRPGLKFADGSPLTSAEVIATFKHFQEKGTGPTRAYFMDLSFAADGPERIIITSAKPNPMIDQLLTPNYYAGSPVSPAGLKDPAQLASKTFGAGEYVLDAGRTVSGDRYVYVKNENFYDQEAIDFEEITVQVIPNVTQQVQALKTKQIDAMYADATVGGTAGGGSIEEIYKPNLWRGVYLLDRDGTKVPALKSKEVRQALNMAVDRQAIVNAAYGKYGSPIQQPTPSGTPAYGYDEALNSTYTYDPAKAKELLAKAGYPDGFTLPMSYQSFNGADTKMVQAIAAQLGQIGVKVELKPAANFGEWVGDLNSLNNGATVLGAGGPLYLTSQFGFMPNGVLNPFKVENQAVGEAFNQLSTATEDQIGNRAKDLSKVLVEEAIAMPIAQVDAIFMFNKDKVTGLEYIGESGELLPITAWSAK